MIKISVVIPCLNSVTYIRECLDSLTAQTMHDMEMIIVDAGSEDGTLEIISEYQERDGRIRLIHSEKRSMGHQYNIGMDAANGEWIGFCETDDYAREDMWETLYRWVKDTNVDFIKSDFNMFVDTNEERIFLPYYIIPLQSSALVDKPISISDHREVLLGDLNMWNGIYRKSFLEENHIRLNETPGAAFQDMGFVLQVNMLAGLGIYKRECLYFYRRDNEGSSTYSPKMIRYVVSELKYIRDFLSEHEDCELFQAFICRRFANSFFSKYDEIARHGQSVSDVESEIEYFRSYLKMIWKTETQQELLKSGLWYNLNVRMLMNSSGEFDKYKRMIIEMEKESIDVFLGHFMKKERIVLVGCGEKGKSLLTLMRRKGYKGEVIFADNNQRLWGQEYMGNLIVGVEEAAQKYAGTDFVVTVADSIINMDLRRQLRKLEIPEGHIYMSIAVGAHMVTNIEGK